MKHAQCQCNDTDTVVKSYRIRILVSKIFYNLEVNWMILRYAMIRVAFWKSQSISSYDLTSTVIKLSSHISFILSINREVLIRVFKEFYDDNTSFEWEIEISFYVFDFCNQSFKSRTSLCNDTYITVFLYKLPKGDVIAQGHLYI